eukprot:1563448-Rhodomonas_salina.1
MIRVARTRDTLREYDTITNSVLVNMDNVDPCWNEPQNVVDHSAKLDTQLSHKAGRFRDWLGDKIGDNVSLVKADLETLHDVTLSRARMRMLWRMCTKALDSFWMAKNHEDEMDEIEHNAHLASVHLFEFVLVCKEYAEWLLMTASLWLTSEVKESINDVIKSYETLSSQDSALMQYVAANHRELDEHAEDVDDDYGDYLLLSP